MKQYRTGLVVFLGLALMVTGCMKKSTDQANLSGTGFDSLATTEDLAQLPQAATANQQAAIEVLPIETSPVTQSVPAPMSMDQTLSQEQKIQTALKNAGLYNGSIDGKIGPGSRKAIETFQTNNGLKVDGKVGPKTWAALEPFLTGSAVTTSVSTVE